MKQETISLSILEGERHLVRNLAFFSLDVVAALTHEFHLDPLWYPSAQSEVRAILRSIQKDPLIPKGYRVDPGEFQKYPEDEVAQLLMARLPLQWIDLFCLWSSGFSQKRAFDSVWRSTAAKYKESTASSASDTNILRGSALLAEVGRRVKDFVVQERQRFQQAGVSIDFVCDGIYSLSDWDDYALTQFVPTLADDEDERLVYLFGPDIEDKYENAYVTLSLSQNYWFFVESWNDVMNGASPEVLAVIDVAARSVFSRPDDLPPAHEVAAYCAREVAAFRDLSAALERALAKAGGSGER